MQEELKRRLEIIAGYEKENPFGDLGIFDWAVTVLLFIALPLLIVIWGA